MVLPDMLKNAPMFKRVEAQKAGKKAVNLGVGRGRAAAMRAAGGGKFLFFICLCFLYVLSSHLPCTSRFVTLQVAVAVRVVLVEQGGVAVASRNNT